MSDSPLFARARVIVEGLPKPAIIVGLPRSGTSLLASVLSQSSDYFVFDDLYLYRKVMSLGVEGPLTEEQLDRLIYYLGWQIRARIKFGVFDATRTSMSLDDVDRMDESLRVTFKGEEVLWHELMVEWLGRLALNEGRCRWGFKAPQDFFHIDKYVQLFPDVKFIYVHRDPREMMASLKYVRDQDGSPNQYHPFVYARYWQMASDIVDAAQRRYPSRILCMSYHDLVLSPQDTADQMAEFLETLVESVSLGKSNSSFPSSSRRKSITSTEIQLCERVAGRSMQARGYAIGNGGFRWKDLPDLALVTLRFMLYQARRTISDPAARYSIRKYLSALRGKGDLGR